MNENEMLEKWLKENQNKPVDITIMAYELGTELVFPLGYEIDENMDLEEDGFLLDLYLNESKGKNSIHIIMEPEDQFELIIGRGSVQLDGDMQISINEHFTLVFRLF